MVLDDIDSRSGSTVSLLRTFVGLFLREIGGWISVADFIKLMQDVGVSSAATRNAIAKLKQKQLLVPERRSVAGYALNPLAVPMLERGDKRIFTVNKMLRNDRWGLISFSVAESERAKRGRLRRQLQWRGCGTVAPGLWICPEYLLDEVRIILQGEGVNAVTFVADEPSVAGGFADAAAGWWDLDAIRAAYESFMLRVRPIQLASGRVRDTGRAFAAYVTVIDEWRIIPYLDPGLPEHLLPADWPGEAAQQTFKLLTKKLRAKAFEHIFSVLNVPTDASRWYS